MKINGYTLVKVVAGVIAAVTLTGCSLLKVSVSTGDPLPKEDVRARMLTRGFYYDMASDIARTADSIAASAPELGMRVAAVRWKIRATRAGVSAAMQAVPEVALADMWILCRRMDEAFAAAPDSLLFGPQSDLARATAGRLDTRVQRLARQVLAPARYDLMEGFVEQYVRENPVTQSDVEAANTTLAWVEYLRDNGIEQTYATGSISEVLSDVNDRLSGQTQQLTNTIGWSKDIFEMQWQQDSLRTQLGTQLDSLSRSFERIVGVAEQIPGISQKALDDLDKQLTLLMRTMNVTVGNAFADVDRQRGELQEYVSKEREALVEQLRTTADDVVATALDGLPGLVGKVLLYLVLALVVLIGGPFALGFWLGGVRQRARERKK